MLTTLAKPLIAMLALSDTAIAQTSCNYPDPLSAMQRSSELLQIAGLHFNNAYASSDPVESCEDMTSAVSALTEEYETEVACGHQQMAIKTMGIIRTYNSVRSGYCAAAAD
jgi:hypothetical protein